jgi:ATP-dependent helicase YprA (DUF1998 family)
MATLLQAIQSTKTRHIEYIESAYHIRHPQIILERRALLEGSTGVATSPWLEATPAYKPGSRLEELQVPAPLKQLLLEMGSRNLGVFNPLYDHQSRALESFFREGKDLVVSSGTGSGKTEIFLYSILGNLVLEGARRKSTSVRGVRALILYPMNALVSDQLSRLRRTLGRPESAIIIERAFGRTVQFGMYTGRTPYHGQYNPDKNDRYVRPLVKFYAELQTRPDPRGQALFRALGERGRIPSKNLAGFLGERNDPRESKYRTQPGDRELLTRQEMTQPNAHGGTPDILVTNYSMLEYMLLRPLEQPVFRSTRDWLKSDPANELILVVDEAHLYRGAQGAEVALLIRRLLNHLGIGRDRVRCILTSASLGDSEHSAENGRIFGSKLTGGAPEKFDVILGKRVELGGQPPLAAEFGEALLKVNRELEPSSLSAIASFFGWMNALPAGLEAMRHFLGKELPKTAEYRALHDALSRRVVQVQDAAKELFPSLPAEDGSTAVLNFALLATIGLREDGNPLLPVKVHVMYRGVPRLFACVNTVCQAAQGTPSTRLLGPLSMPSRMSCEHCGSRVLELMGHRTCGAVYLRGYFDRLDVGFPHFLWTENEGGGLREVHLLLEEPRGDPDPLEESGLPLNKQLQACFLDKSTGYVLDRLPGGGSATDFLRCWWPPLKAVPKEKRGKAKVAARPPSGDDQNAPSSWRRCGACGIDETKKKGPSKIEDHETTGEDPFANIVKSLFISQSDTPDLPPDLEAMLPNRGRKVLCFSDGRQKAARLARDLQRIVEKDSFRDLLALAVQRASSDAPISAMFAYLVAVTSAFRISLFDDGDETEAGDYEGSRTRFGKAQFSLPKLLKDYHAANAETLFRNRHARNELSGLRPRQYDQQLLRALGDPNFSLKQTLVGYVAPTKSTSAAVQALNTAIDATLVDSTLLAAIDAALLARAFDPNIRPEDRRMSRSSARLPLGYSDGEEGLGSAELLPPDVRRALTLSPDIVEALNDSFHVGEENAEPLFVLANGRYWLNPAAVTLRLDPRDDWKRCDGCGRFSPYDIQGRCPDFECRGRMSAVQSSDLYLRTRKDFLRNPVLEVLGAKGEPRRPFVIRSEEHTAQLTTKDSAEVFGKAERYELLFQDILVDGDTRDGQTQQVPVDVLSCTTTMEVGIDIGSLTAVALRTVPPRPDNYQQRAGRAGRRSAALSMIATFADSSPHETYVFENPERMIGVSSAPPVLYVENRRIVERHLNAALIQEFFQRLEDPDITKSVFESLGNSRDFFLEKGPFSAEAFETWIHDLVLTDEDGRASRLGGIIPDEVADHNGIARTPTWRLDFVKQVASALSKSLGERKQLVATRPRDEGSDDGLLSELIDAGYLPTFGFPIDLCGFVVRDFNRGRGVGGRGRVGNRYEMTQDLSQALSEYIPGRDIVVDKHTFTSYGLYFPVTQDPTHRARSAGWDSSPWLNYCDSCKISMEEDTENLEAKGQRCLGGHAIKSIRRFRPEAFAPQVSQARGALEGGGSGSERLTATLAEFPAPVEPRPPKGIRILEVSPLAEVRTLPNQLLIVANRGLNREGFQVCRDCGAVSLDKSLPQSHDRPYQLEIWLARKSSGQQCTGPTIDVAFAHDFRTDLAILSVQARPPLRFAFDSDWFRGAATSLSEALVLGATRALAIDPSELTGNWRYVAKYEGDPPDTMGHLEFFLYDTTPGGAGFAAEAGRKFSSVLGETRDVLTDCECDASCYKCLRTYDNRYFHNSLSRTDALRLLTYAESGTIPKLTSERRRRLLEQVARAVSLIYADVGTDVGDPIRLGFQRRGARVHLEVESVFLEMNPPLTPGPPGGPAVMTPLRSITVTDYDIVHRLPWVIEQINAALRQA